MAKRTTKKARAKAPVGTKPKARTTGRSTLKAKSKRPPARRSGDGAARMSARRSDLGADVGVYWSGLQGRHREIAEALHALVMAAAPKASAAIKWGMPVYEHHGKLCYVQSRPAYVTLGFYEQGASLTDPRGLLGGAGVAMRHVKCMIGDALPVPYLTSLVRQAARMNKGD